MQINFRLFEVADLAALRSWFGDAELARRLSYPSDGWLAYVTGTPSVRCWVAINQAGDMIAALQVDRDDGANSGLLDIALRPDLRGRSIGTAVLRAFLAGPGKNYPVLEGRVENDNLAGLACVRNCGFALLPDRDGGSIRAVRRVSPTADLQGIDTNSEPSN